MSYKHSASHSELFDAPASSVWDLLTDWGGIIDWMPDGYIKSLRLEGEGRGAIRHLVTGQGVTISERLDHMDEDRGILYLSIIDPLPWDMLSYKARAQLEYIDPAQCRLNWRGTFELAQGGQARDELAAVLKNSYVKMFQGIRNELSGKQMVEADE